MAEVLDRVEAPDLELLELAPEDAPPRVPPEPPPGLQTAPPGHEALARRDLRWQIASIEFELAQLLGSAFRRTEIEFRVPAPGGPRVLGVDELERVRDALAGRLQGVKGRLDESGRAEQRKRALIEEMVADPASHKWIRVSNQDIGEPGCRHWHSRPRWGPIGLLLSWWRVRVSSGCPLAAGVMPPSP